jgi:hypothetical protein
MKCRRMTGRGFALAILAGLAAFLGGDGSVLNNGALVGSAEAVRGRPATPLSYAGVARRTTRRAVAAGAATKCVQVVDSYGRVVTRCY